MERLTPAEEQVMLKLWKLGKAAVKEIQELYGQGVRLFTKNIAGEIQGFSFNSLTHKLLWQ